MPDSKNSKISELTELTTPVGADIVPIVDSSDSETKKITYTNLVAGQTTGIAANAANIATNAANIASNITDIATNATNISTNQTDLITQGVAISNNAANIFSNETDIATNATNIATNAANIGSNDTDIATNSANIATNAANIATNATNIASNDTDIATNATNIASNDTDIATNAANIAANTANIATKAPLAQPDVQDSLTVTATVSPDQDAKVELVDKSTGATKQGGLYKKDGSLYVGTFTDYTKNLRCFQQGADQVYAFPNNSGIRFHGGDLLETYEHHSFSPTLNISGVTQSSYNNRTGYYTKFGRKVTFHVEINVQNPDAAIKLLYSNDPTGNIRVDNLPFAAQWDSTFILRPVQGFINCAGTQFPLYGHLDSGSTSIYFERGVEIIGSGSQVAGQGINTRRLRLNDFSINPFDFVASGTTNKFRFSLSGVYMSNVD
tara:strand:- start:796 stop:2115 length:1320 start_codon:yes stop_codon:yes gene_type:complete